MLLTFNRPRPGTKLSEVNCILRQPNGATLAEIDKATKQNAWSYQTNGSYLAKRYVERMERTTTPALIK